ncbi:MAG: hypothetical protein Q4D95_01910 [Peptoniphilus sp.]|nr:hypothetical protein [Peptoniphilus sp.]
MEKKILFYGMTKEKMCFNHILLNALDLSEAGFEVKIIFEGGSVKLIEGFEQESSGPYKKAKEKGLIAGICYACSKVMGVLEVNEKSNLPLLKDMNGHAGMKKYAEEGYQIISM